MDLNLIVGFESCSAKSSLFVELEGRTGGDRRFNSETFVQATRKICKVLAVLKVNDVKNLVEFQLIFAIGFQVWLDNFGVNLSS